MKLKRLVTAFALAVMLALPSTALATPDGCNSVGCWYTGWWIEWNWWGPQTCGWWQMFYYTGEYMYQDCHSNYMGWY